MENINLIFFIVLTVLLCSNLMFCIFIFYRTRAYAQDHAEAMKLVMNYLTKTFDNNSEQHQNMQTWTENTLEKMVELENNNSQKIFNLVAQQQIYSSRLGEFLGYRPRGNIDS
jgi:hypothetical protein